jgi:hypothetical protein
MRADLSIADASYEAAQRPKVSTWCHRGSLTHYAGSVSPGADKESNWLPAPDGAFSLYVRAYWGKEAILDGTWQPPKIDVAQ